MSSRAVLYSAVGDVITRYMIDVDSATLHRMESVTVASKVQYAWPHPSGGFLYVSTSDGGPRVESHHNQVALTRWDLTGNSTLTAYLRDFPTERYICVSTPWDDLSSMPTISSAAH